MKKTLLLAVSVLAAALFVSTAFSAAPAKAIIVTVQGMQCQACADGLQKDLAKVPGVTAVKASLAAAQVTASLDETKTSAAAFVNAIAAHPQMMDAKKNYGAKLVIYVDAPMCVKEKVMCPACPPEMTKMLNAVKGISAISIGKTGKIVTVGFAKGAQVTTQVSGQSVREEQLPFRRQFCQAGIEGYWERHPWERMPAGMGRAGCPRSQGRPAGRMLRHVSRRDAGAPSALLFNVPGQLSLQFGAGARQAGLDRAGRYGEDGGDLFDGQPFQMVQDEHVAVFVGEGLQCLSHLSAQFMFEEQFFASGGTIGDLQCRAVFLAADRRIQRE